ncbi:MAG: hypothetical protein AB7O24_28425 [Kofleriaceae bacterium]
MAIVSFSLRPGEASYADWLNDGNDLQEYEDMSALSGWPRIISSRTIRR